MEIDIVCIYLIYSFGNCRRTSVNLSVPKNGTLWGLKIVMGPMKSKNLTIGKLAKAAGVNVETVRYYQRRKLVETPVKPNQGFRVYPLETLHRIKFIKRAQELGFSLAEVRQLLNLSKGNCAAMEDLARHKLVKIEDKIADLNRMQIVLSDLVEACEANQDPQTCPIIESLAINSV